MLTPPTEKAAFFRPPRNVEVEPVIRLEIVQLSLVVGVAARIAGRIVFAPDQHIAEVAEVGTLIEITGIIGLIDIVRNFRRFRSHHESPLCANHPDYK